MEEIITTFVGMEIVESKVKNRFYLKKGSLFLVVNNSVVEDWIISDSKNDIDTYYTDIVNFRKGTVYESNS